MSIDFRQFPVLFVDDEEPNRVVFRAAFGRELEVRLAACGDEALRILAAEPVAVLVADQRMPGMTGVELAEIVRRDYPEVVRIIVTAYADIHAAIDAINRGQVTRYISKPWNSDEVRSYLRGAVELCHINRRVQELQSQVLNAERLAGLGLVASSIAHDLGSPLVCLLNDLDGVMAELEALQADAAEEPGLGERLTELMESVQDCRGYAEGITRILDAVRSTIRQTPVRQPVPLATSVQTAIRLIRTAITHKAALRLHCDDGVVVLGDAAALTQLVINLLANAANAIPAGRQGEHEVSLEVTREDGAAVLRVRDTGCGIPPGIIERIFEPMFTTRMEEGGTGIGLSIVRRIVEEHRGSIAVESTPGHGTVFTVRLACAD